MLSEVTFIHERATVYGWYWATQTILSSVLNIASSYETANLSWRQVPMVPTNTSHANETAFLDGTTGSTSSPLVLVSSWLSFLRLKLDSIDLQPLLTGS